MNSTKNVIQKMNEESQSIKSEIERTNSLSYIATALGVSDIIILYWLTKIHI
ncbi:MAG TPA: hypothetical protein VFP49_06560 [Nitrososphaeraceae archaeon]|nr:hypothetical protein [Nitrososphaeraceae archaeon]